MVAAKAIVALVDYHSAVAIVAFRYPATIMAQERVCETPSVQEEQCLFAFAQGVMAGI